jgi:hypothetical protein
MPQNRTFLIFVNARIQLLKFFFGSLVVTGLSNGQLVTVLIDIPAQLD